MKLSLEMSLFLFLHCMEDRTGVLMLETLELNLLHILTIGSSWLEHLIWWRVACLYTVLVRMLNWLSGTDNLWYFAEATNISISVIIG